MSRAVFLDRDGVLNRTEVRDGKPYAPATVAELEILPGVPGALAALKKAGYLLIVVSNQPDVARGIHTRASVDAIDAALRSALPELDDICICFHDDGDGCNCRKPRPGLLLDAAARYGIALSESFMVGDRWRDIDAGAAAGCRTILIDYGYRERAPQHPPDARVHALDEAARWILENPVPRP